jgi:hypothetical protein
MNGVPPIYINFNLFRLYSIKPIERHPELNPNTKLGLKIKDNITHYVHGLII